MVAELKRALTSPANYVDAGEFLDQYDALHGSRQSLARSVPSYCSEPRLRRKAEDDDTGLAETEVMRCLRSRLAAAREKLLVTLIGFDKTNAVGSEMLDGCPHQVPLTIQGQ